jgi:hypothetical protein
MNYFLVFFIDFFIFFEFKFKFEFWGGSTARYRYRTPAVTAVYRAVPSGKKNPATSTVTTLVVLKALRRPRKSEHALVPRRQGGLFSKASRDHLDA